MAYVSIADFKYGVDRRRPRVAGTPGTLWNGINVHISRGGDIERAKKFVPTFTLPAGTFGLGEIGGQLYTFGSADLSASMPSGVQYIRLQNAASAAITRVLHVNVFNGSFYIIAEYADGSIHHFYNATRVTAWDALAETNSSHITLADYLARKINTNAAVSAISFGQRVQITAAVPGTAFTVSAGAVDGGTTATGTTVNGNTGLTSLSADLSDRGYVGGTITGTGIPLGTTIVSVTATTIVVSQPATADGTGITFTIATNNDQTAVVSTPTANVAAVAEVRATGTVTITGGTRDPGVNFISQVTVNGVNMLTVPVNWVTSNTATATALVAGINNNTSTHGYSASSLGAVVTLRAPVGSGATKNGHVVARTVAGDVTATVANISGGVTAVTAVAQISLVTFGGTYQARDKYTITVNGTDYVAQGRASGHATHALVYKTREYATANSLYYWSAINTPNDWSTSGESGFGFLNLANDSEGSDRLLCSVQYQQGVAIFARKSIRIYSLSTVASENAFVQSLENTGTVAPRSVLSYGNTDVFYLDETGIRSLQAREVSDAAFVKDAGSAIDPLVADWLDTLDEATIERAVAVVEPSEGRYLLAIDERIYVLSNFPSSKVNAWTYYEPGFVVTDFVRSGRRLYARDTTTVYLYGGADNETYPDAGELTATVELPFVSAGEAATFKAWQGFDMALTGEWTVNLLADPNDETKLIEVGVLDKITYNLPDLATVGEFPLFALKAVCTAAGPATISNCVFHYEKTTSG